MGTLIVCQTLTKENVVIIYRLICFGCFIIADIFRSWNFTLCIDEVTISKVVLNVTLLLRITTFLNMEVIEQIGHFTIQECRSILLGSCTLGKRIIRMVITINNISIIANNCFHIGSAGSIYPTILGMAIFITIICNTATSERTGHTKVVHFTAELAKERVVKVTDSVSIAVQCTSEALSITTN